MNIYSEVQKLKRAIKPNWILTHFEPMLASTSEPGGEYGPQMIINHYIFTHFTKEDISDSDINYSYVKDMNARFEKEIIKNSAFKRRYNLVLNKLSLDSKVYTT
jgi:hypothetical protein